jgi:hypothetical protein
MISATPQVQPGVQLFRAKLYPCSEKNSQLMYNLGVFLLAHLITTMFLLEQK